MQRTPIYYFENMSEIGIDKVPNNKIIVLKDDSTGLGTGLPREVIKIGNTGMGPTSTIQDFLAVPALYIDVATGGGAGGGAGKSAYEVALALDPTIGTEAQWLADLQGDPGVIGPQGRDGKQGKSGLQGQPGQQGIAGVGVNIGSPVADDAARNALTQTPGLSVLQIDTGAFWTSDGTNWVHAGKLVGPQGAQGVKGDEGPSAVSADAGNTATIGTDSKIFVPASAASVERVGISWTASTAYKADDIVVVDDGGSKYLVRRIAAGTSGAAFNAVEKALWSVDIIADPGTY